MKYGCASPTPEMEEVSRSLSESSDASFEIVSAETSEPSSEPDVKVSSPFKPLVTFHDIFDVYPVDADLIARVSFGDEFRVSDEDTVIVVPLAWTSVNQAVCSSKLLNNYVKFNVADLPKACADEFYQLCYCTTADLNVVGVSTPFFFREVHEEELMEFEKEQNTEFWTFRSRFAVLTDFYWNALERNRTVQTEDIQSSRKEAVSIPSDITPKVVEENVLTNTTTNSPEVLNIDALLISEKISDDSEKSKEAASSPSISEKVEKVIPLSSDEIEDDISLEKTKAVSSISKICGDSVNSEKTTADVNCHDVELSKLQYQLKQKTSKISNMEIDFEEDRKRDQKRILRLESLLTGRDFEVIILKDKLSALQTDRRLESKSEKDRMKKEMEKEYRNQISELKKEVETKISEINSLKSDYKVKRDHDRSFISELMRKMRAKQRSVDLSNSKLLMLEKKLLSNQIKHLPDSTVKESLSEVSSELKNENSLVDNEKKLQNQITELQQKLDNEKCEIDSLKLEMQEKKELEEDMSRKLVEQLKTIRKLKEEQTAYKQSMECRLKACAKEYTKVCLKMRQLSERICN